MRPVLCIFDVPDAEAAIAAHAPCPYALTAAIFGPEPEARALASRLTVGTVLINDLIVATADPRVAFGGRKSSGFGVTRGREGLLEMTALKTVITQRSRDLRAYQPTTPGHQPFFAAYLEAVHGGNWLARWKGFLPVSARGHPARSRLRRNSNMRVAVIGSGLGGLSAACTLAARGYEVEVFEKNPWLGGKAAVLEEQGFRFDMGPTILIQPSVLAAYLLRSRAQHERLSRHGPSRPAVALLFR